LRHVIPDEHTGLQASVPAKATDLVAAFGTATLIGLGIVSVGLGLFRLDAAGPVLALPALGVAVAATILVVRLLVHDEQQTAVWSALKAWQGLGLVFAHTVMGMVNYPFSFFAAVVTVPYFSLAHRPRTFFGLIALAVSFSVSVGAVWWLFPLMVADESQWSAETLRGNSLQVAQQMSRESGALFWPYLCAVFFSAQVISAGLVLGS